MNTKALLLCLLAAAVMGCTYGGHYVRSGPCEGWKADAAACERAYANRGNAAKVVPGQTRADVRALMGEPERRELSGDVERWGYLTDYDADMLTVIVFTTGTVSGIEQRPATE